MYDYKKCGDFEKYYDTTQQRNIWVFGYFGSGSINIADAYEIAKDFAEENDVELKTVQMDEILSSSRHTGFKFVYSQTIQLKDPAAIEMENVYQWLRD